MKKKLVSFVVGLVLVISSIGLSYGLDETTDKVLQTKDGTNIIQSIDSYQNMCDWSSYINWTSGSSVTIGGHTETGTSVDSVYVKVILQKYDTSTGRWVSVTETYSQKNDTDYVSVYKSATITAGYSYRVYSIHTSTEGSTTETKYFYSDSISIN